MHRSRFSASFFTSWYFGDNVRLLSF